MYDISLERGSAAPARLRGPGTRNVEKHWLTAINPYREGGRAVTHKRVGPKDIGRPRRRWADGLCSEQVLGSALTLMMMMLLDYDIGYLVSYATK
jgi:hypothetical protein